MCNVRLSDRDDESKLIDTRYITVHRIALKGRYNPHEFCSKIQLQGKWILSCGFKPDDKLHGKRIQE